MSRRVNRRVSRRPPWAALIIAPVATIALAVLGSSSCAASAPTGDFAPAQPSYSKPAQSGQSAPAPTGQSVPAQPGYSAPALYNLANAYARAGKPGLAVLNYERAKLLDPSDPDVDANLRHVREASGFPPKSRNALDRVTGIASPRILAWVGVLGLLIAGVSALARRRYPRHRFKLLAATLVGISVLGVTIANAIALWPIMHEAVVIAHAAPVRASPVPIEEAHFELPEATIVRMSDVHDGFALVQTQEGRSGWVPVTSLAPVLPKTRR
jgi:hypothetical protein